MDKKISKQRQGINRKKKNISTDYKHYTMNKVKISFKTKKRSIAHRNGKQREAYMCYIRVFPYYI